MDENKCKELLINSVAGSMALSDMELTEEDIERIRLAADDPKIAEEIVQQLIVKHTIPAEEVYRSLGISTEDIAAGDDVELE